MVRGRTLLLVVGVIASLLLLLLPSERAFAVAKLVQVQSAAANGTTISATYSPAAKTNHLLVIVCASRTVTPFTTPTGFTVAKSELTTAPVQAIYYKVATGGETTVSCRSTGTSRKGIQIYEYSGTLTSTPLETVNAATSRGTSTTASSGALTTTSPKALVVAAIVAQSSGTGVTAWSNSFTERADFTSTARFGGADRYTTTSGSYTTAATMTVSSTWRGQIAAFKLLPETLSGDIVNASNVSVTNPAAAFAARTFDFNCQASTATLGVAAQQIRVVNTTANAAWTLSIAPTNGPTAVWSDGGTNTYDVNDPTGAGCSDGVDPDAVAGRLTVDPSVATVTPDASCSATGITKGTQTAFEQGVADSIPLVIGTASSEINCTWNITGVALSQQIPAEAAPASYSLGLTITLAAN